MSIKNVLQGVKDITGGVARSLVKTRATSAPVNSVVDNFVSGLKQAGNALSKSNFLPVRMYNTAQQVAGIPQVRQQISNFSDNVGNTVSSIPYKVQENKIKFNFRNKTPVNWGDPVALQGALDKITSNAPKWGGSYVPPALTNIGGNVATNPNSWTGSFDPVGQMQEFSHPQQMTYNNPQINTSPMLEQIKQNVISKLRPAAREFLNKVPIGFDKMDQGNLGQSRGKGTPGRNVAISDTFLKPANPNLSPARQEEYKKYQAGELEKVIEHELLHQTPRLVPTNLFKPENEVVVKNYTERWGQDYMDRPGSLVEEMFAEQDLPPAYYWHVFKNVNPNATEKNFIDTLKAYFVNSINTPYTETAVAGSSTPQIAPQVGRIMKIGKTIKK